MPKKTPNKASEKKVAKNLGGRPEIKITKAVLSRAKRLASQGLTREQISKSMRMGESTFYDKLNKYPELREAIEEGELNGIEKLTNSLYKKAVKGDLGALKYSLNNRDKENWKERHEVKVDVEDVTLSPTERKKRMKELLTKCQ